MNRRGLLKRAAGVFGAAIAASGSSSAAPAKTKPNPKLAQQRERRRVKVITRVIERADQRLVAEYEADIWHLQNELRTGKRSQFRPERLGE